MALASSILSLFPGCSSTSIEDDSPPEAQYTEGERLFKKGRYLEASERFRILKNRHPYSIYAALAALRIGDVYFEQETYLEAASAYKVFLELYPKHTQADYALFRVGEGNYRLVPDDIDRDIDSANAAISAFRRLEKDYPASQYLARAKDLEKELRQKLADKEEYVGDYYFRHENFLAASGRYRNIIQEFPETGKNEKALYRLAYSYEKMGEKEKALEALERLNHEFPRGKFIKDAAQIQLQLEKKK